jgi:hypothetical protein
MRLSLRSGRVGPVGSRGHSDLIDGSIGEASMFHETFGY